MATPDPKANFSHTDLVRMYESTCSIAMPNQLDLNFRFALQKLIAQRLDLAALKDKTLAGPLPAPPAQARRPDPAEPKPAQTGRR
jgi:hypothetical protein